MSNITFFIDRLALFLIGALLVYGSIKDMRYRSVPNIISILTFLLACVVVIVNDRVVESSMSFFLIFTGSLVLYSVNFFGGADAKILMALSPLISLENYLFYLILLCAFLFTTAVCYFFLSLQQFVLIKKEPFFNKSVPFFVPITFCYFFVLYLGIDKNIFEVF